jgi:regulator of ribonuclease activity A
MTGCISMIPTTDLCDAHEDRIADGRLMALTPGWLSFGRHSAFCGPAVTLKVFEDNSLIAEAVRTAGVGRVLVIDGGGSLRCALVGGNLAKAAAENGWQGIIVNGAIRDADELDALNIGVRALALHPVRSIKRGEGCRDLAVAMPGAVVHPGDWIYADRDGVLVSREAL